MTAMIEEVEQPGKLLNVNTNELGEKDLKVRKGYVDTL